MEEGRGDIFNGRFGDQQELKKEELSFSKGAGNIATGLAQIFNGFKHILLKKFPFNVLFLLIIIGASIVGTYFLKPGVTGMVVQNVTPECPVCEETVCPECVCEDCPECPVCEEETKVEKVNIFYYICPDGKIVNKSSGCETDLPKITSEYKSEANGVLLSIDGVEYESEKIKRINYTIINQGFEDIKPQLLVKVYEQWNSDVMDAEPDKKIDFNGVIKPNNWVIRSDGIDVDIESNEKKIRLELRDALITPSESIVTVVREFR